jgi:hydrogenase expression/formation protein HypD
MAIFKHGIRSILNPKIHLISGPGCPVCVTSQYFINAAIELADKEDIIITTFGDMLKIPGESQSLLDKKAEGSDIRIIYSPLDVLEIAVKNPDKKVVMLSVGFETTTPVIALAVIKAKERNIKNFYVLTANKTIPNALEALSADDSIKIDGYLYPGHVSAIIGTSFYKHIASVYKIPGVVTGFEAMDLLISIALLTKSINKLENRVYNTYNRVVKEEGNIIAVETMNRVFEKSDSIWRGLGTIRDSGLSLRQEYIEFDAWKIFDLKVYHSEDLNGCRCGDILKGKITPNECPLFMKLCTPENPVGACMVSSEGTCAAYYKYRGDLNG